MMAPSAKSFTWLSTRRTLPSGARATWVCASATTSLRSIPASAWERASTRNVEYMGVSSAPRICWYSSKGSRAHTIPGSLSAVTPLAWRYRTNCWRPAVSRCGVRNTGARWGSKSVKNPDSHQCPDAKSTIALAGPLPAIDSDVIPSRSIPALFRYHS